MRSAATKDCEILLEEIDRLNKKCAALAKLVYPVHPDPTGKTREPPHCPTCDCGQDKTSLERPTFCEHVRCNLCSPQPQTEKQT